MTGFLSQTGLQPFNQYLSRILIKIYAVLLHLALECGLAIYYY